MPYYKYIPNTILENETIKLYWDTSLITDKTIHNNRPDITLVDKLSKTVYFIDIAIPNNHNLKAVATIPVTLSTNGIIPETLYKALNTLNLHPKTFIELQKATVLNTCSIVRKFFNIS
jgi:hypothetical protein